MLSTLPTSMPSTCFEVGMAVSDAFPNLSFSSILSRCGGTVIGRAKEPWVRIAARTGHGAGPHATIGVVASRQRRLNSCLVIAAVAWGLITGAPEATPHHRQVPCN